MLILEALVRTVASEPVTEVNKETGKQTEVWLINVEHEDRDGLKIQKLKAKTQTQADAWKRCTGRNIRTPINVIPSRDGKNYFLWIESGQLPQLVTEQPKAAA